MRTTTAVVIVGIAAVAFVYYAAKHDTYPLPIPPPTDSGISGTVFLGPTCPVMRDPPDPNCRDRPYKTTIDVLKYGADVGRVIVISVETDTAGTFRIPLNPGSYVIEPRGGPVLPRCGTMNVDIKAREFQSVELSCDTGIR